MKIAAGTTNPSKIKGIERAYKRLLHKDVEVIGVKVESGVSAQPLSLEETIRGAINRAKQAIKEISEADEGVGVEAGFFKLLDKTFDVQIAVIIDRENHITYGLSPAFQIPPFFVNKVLNEGIELEVVVDNYFGTKNIGIKGGFISILTKNRITREELTELAVAMALIPRIWRKLYQSAKHG